MTKRNRRTMEEAANLLACCASQPDELRDGGWFGTMKCPGSWSRVARDFAYNLRFTIDGADWREAYAEAEARIREELAK